MGSLVRSAAVAAWCGGWCCAVACGGSARHSDQHAPTTGKSNASSGAGSTEGGSNDGSTPPGEGGAGPAPAIVIEGFETSDTMGSLGLWMGFDGGMLPIAMPTVPHDGSALHLVGKTDEKGLDVFFHTGIPVERIWSSVRFWSQSDQPNSRLIVAVAGPEASYFTDRAQGIAWPQQLVMVGPEWRETVVTFSALGIGPDHLSPHSETFGAFHFIIEPNTEYDLWLDDFAGQPLYRSE